MGFKAAASELGTEGGLRTRTDTDTVKAKSIRIRTYPYALETCLEEVLKERRRPSQVPLGFQIGTVLHPPQQLQFTHTRAPLSRLGPQFI